MQLVPVDHDPFAASPAGPKLVPVDHDPFATQPDTATDVMKSAAGGTERGLAGTAMILPNLINSAVAGPQLLGRGIAENVDKMIGVEPQPRGPLWKPFYDSEDVLQALPKPLQPHNPQTPAGMAADMAGQIVGGVVGAKGVETAGEKAGIVPPKPSAPEPKSIQDMYDQAGSLYDQADQAAAVTKAPKMQAMIGDIKTALQANGFDPDFHPETAKWLAKMEAKSADAEGNPVDMPWSKVNGMRKLLNGVISDSMKKGGTEDGYQAIAARNALDQGTSSISPADLASGDPSAIPLTKQANALWSAATKAEEIQNILDKGESAAVPATAYKNGFAKLAQKLKANPSGYTQEEIDAINHAAKTGIVTGALKNAGSRLMSGLVGTAAGTSVGGPLGAPVGFVAGETAAYPLRAAANAIQRGKGNAVIDMIGNRPQVQSAFSTPPIAGTNIQPPVNATAIPTLAATAGATAAQTDRPPAAANTTPTVSPTLPASPPPTALDTAKQSLGIRNNNPGNLRSGDGKFRTYDTPQQGIDAIAQNLVAYGTKHGINTAAGIANRWAPPNENNTGAYAKTLADALGVPPDAPINLKDPVTLHKLTGAIIQQENGRNPYRQTQIVAAVITALNSSKG